MVADHKSDIMAFEKESTKNDAAGRYAKETLPTWRKHLQAPLTAPSAADTDAES